MPTLDHTAYPHIFDEIVASAPLASLVALRATSRRMRQRADALLFAHVALVPTHSGSYEVRNATLSTRLPAPPLTYESRLRGACTNTGANTPIPRTCAGDELALARAVDVHAPDGLPLPRAPLLEVVRRAAPGPCPLVATTFVDYIDLAQAGYGGLSGLGAGGFGMPPADVTLAVPLGVQRHVVHVSFIPERASLKLALGHPASVREVVVVLDPREAASPRALRRVVTSLLAATTFHLLRGGRVVFVGPGGTRIEDGAGLVGSAAGELDALLSLVPWLGRLNGVSGLVRYRAYEDWVAVDDPRVVGRPLTPREPAWTPFGCTGSGTWAPHRRVTRPAACNPSSSGLAREVELRFEHTAALA